MEADAVAIEPVEPIPETSPAERAVADVLPIGASAADAESVRESVPLWFHTFALGARDLHAGHRTRPRLPPAAARRGSFRGAQRARHRRVRRLLQLPGRGPRCAARCRGRQRAVRRLGACPLRRDAAGRRRLPRGRRLIASRVEYHRMDALDVRELGERFDVALCFGILHRVTDPIALLQVLADVLTPGGEIVLETYGSHLPGDCPGDRGSRARRRVRARRLRLLGLSPGGSAATGTHRRPRRRRDRRPARDRRPPADPRTATSRRLTAPHDRRAEPPATSRQPKPARRALTSGPGPTTRAARELSVRCRC